MRQGIISTLIALLIVIPSVFAATVVDFRSPLASTTPQFQAATELYGPGVTDVYPAQDDAFSSAFPYHQLFIVQDDTEWGSAYHTIAWNPQNSKAFDVTRQYNALMSDAIAVVASTADAIKYARAYAQTANAELQLSRKVLNTSDSTLLGTSVASPTATTAGILQYGARLSTWTRDNGVLANWTLNFSSNRMSRVTWEVKATYTGPFFIDPQGILFQPGHFITIDFSGSGGSGSVGSGIRNGDGTVGNVASIYSRNDMMASSPVVVLLPPEISYNEDGTQWHVLYPEEAATLPTVEFQELQAWAQALAAGAADVYGKMVTTNAALSRPGYCAGNANDTAGTPSTGYNPKTSWGFTTSDNDCIYEIVIGGPNALVGCASPDNSPSALPRNESIHVTADFDLCRLMLKATTGDNSVYIGTSLYDMARAIVSHELYHILQVDAGGSSTAPKAWVEGQAVFAATVAATDVESGPNSLYNFWQMGFMTNLDKGICWFDQLPLDTNPLMAYAASQDTGAPISPATAATAAPRMNNSGYMFGPFWGYVYSQATPGNRWDLMRELARLSSEIDSGSCEGMVSSLTAALREDPALAGINMLEVVEGLTEDVLGQTFAWAGEQWSHGPQGLPPVSLSAGQEMEHWGRIWGSKVIALDGPVGGTPTIRCDYRGSVLGGWSVRLLAVDSSGAREVGHVGCGGTATLATVAWSEGNYVRAAGELLYLNVIRSASPDKQFWSKLES